MPVLKLRFKYTILFLSSIILLLSCSTTRSLEEDQRLLHKVKLKNTKGFIVYDLEDLIKQNPNRKVFGTTPYLHVYRVGKLFFDSTRIVNRGERKLDALQTGLNKYANDTVKYRKHEQKIKSRKEKTKLVLNEGNWLMRVVGEPPVIYDTTLTQKTLQQFQNFMFSCGYINGTVRADTFVNRKKLTLSYIFQPGKPFIINDTSYTIHPKELEEILTPYKEQSEFTKGTVFNTETFEKERQFLNSVYKDNGYFHFNKKYIRFELDTTAGNNLVNINTMIDVPSRDSIGKFYVDQVLFKTGKIGKHNDESKDYYYKGINYQTNNPVFARRILHRKLYISRDSLYSLSNTLLTQKSLADLDMFKFINISYFEKNDSVVSCMIKTTPFEKNQISTELGVNVFQSLPGPYGTISFKTRNLINRGETVEFGVQGLIEGQTSPLSPDKVYKSQELSTSISVTFPYFFSPIKLSHKSVNLNPNSKISTRYSYIFRPEFTRSNITSSLKYTWQRDNTKSFSVSPFQLSVINTTEKSPAFNDYLNVLKNNGNNLYLSFNRSIVTSLPISFVYNDYEFGKVKRSRYLRLTAESGGSLVTLFNRFLSNSQNTFLGLDVFQYWKGFVDYRNYIPVKHKNIIASRISFGVAKALGQSAALPYEKYFFTGGSYSNRAWLPRRLGPGSYLPQTADGDPDYSYSFEQPGEIILEGNLEYRFKLSGFINGALFTDASNVWLFKSDTKLRSTFQYTDFYKQIGIGAGFGLRFDFSFLILRLDLAKKIYDPSLEAGHRFTFSEQFFNNKRLTVLNLGIGYPF